MRVLSFVLAAIVATSLAACSKNDTSSTSTSATNAPADTSMSTTATTAPTTAPAANSGAADLTTVPNYPGSTQEAAGSSTQGAGKVLSTSDSFDKVYTWYKGKLPAGSEKTKMTVAGHESAVFQMGTPPKVTAVTITTTGAKTMITVATAK